MNPLRIESCAAERSLGGPHFLLRRKRRTEKHLCGAEWEELCRDAGTVHLWSADTGFFFTCWLDAEKTHFILFFFFFSNWNQVNEHFDLVCRSTRPSGGAGAVDGERRLDPGQQRLDLPAAEDSVRTDSLLPHPADLSLHVWEQKDGHHRQGVDRRWSSFIRLPEFIPKILWGFDSIYLLKLWLLVVRCRRSQQETSRSTWRVLMLPWRPSSSITTGWKKR